MIFLSLPKEIFHLILDYLLLPEHLTGLDNALTNHKLRPIYLEMVDGVFFSSPYLSEDDVNEWMIKRGIYPKNIHFRMDVPDSSHDLLEMCSHVVESLSFQQETSFYYEIIGHYPSLTSLSIEWESVDEIALS
jgi:hypothetical protein